MIKDRSVYLLAAGRGKRAGGPKAWQPHESATLLEKQLSFLLSLFPPEAVAVTIQEVWLDRCRALNQRVRWAPVDPDAPPMSAIHTLMKTAPLDRWTFLYHVDMPLWEEPLFHALSSRIAEAEKNATEAMVPTCRGRSGHPVLLSPKAGAPLAALDPVKDRLDLWLRGRRVARVEVPYPCIHENWNRPRAGP